MHKVYLPRRVEKEFASLPENIQKAIQTALIDLARNPRPYGVKMLSGRLKGSARIRVGAYRILYDIDDKQKEIVITNIGPRKDVYRY